jgi:hypothetical protein
MISAGPDFRAPPQLGELQIAFIILAIFAIATQPQEGFRYVLTSWYRTPIRNMEVGGQSNSLHLAGLALDVAVFDDRPLLTRLSDSIFAEGSLFSRGLQGSWRMFGPAFQALVESDHVHLELDLN